MNQSLEQLGYDQFTGRSSLPYQILESARLGRRKTNQHDLVIAVAWNIGLGYTI